MSGFLLDTNIPSETVRPRPEPKVLFISTVSFGELRKGIALRTPGQRRTELETWIEGDLLHLFCGRTLSVTRSIAERWGTLDAERQRAGRPINIADGMIAATALEHDLILVTRNVKDFAASASAFSTLGMWHESAAIRRSRRDRH